MDEMKRIEKFEIEKNSGNYYYTGYIDSEDGDWVTIKTTRGETLTFRKQQIMQRYLVPENELKS